MVDLGSGQGRSDFATAVVAPLRRGLQKSENADLEQKMPFIDGHYLVSVHESKTNTMGAQFRNEQFLF